MVDDYRISNDISQSKLKDLIDNPIFYKKKWIDKTLNDKESEFMKLGSAVDCKLTDSNNFDNQFIIADFNSITDSVKTLTDYLIKEFDNTMIVDDDDLIYYIQKLNLYGNIKKKEVFIDNLNKYNFFDYYKMRFESKNKSILTTSEYNKVNAFVESLLTNQFTSKYFNPEEGIEILNQKPIYWECNGFDCKSLLDFVVINHNDKTITPVDLKKSSFDTNVFIKSIYKYRLDIQAAFYTDALTQFISTYKILQDYKINNFEFLVENIEYPGSPLIWVMTDTDLNIGRNGGKLNNRKVKGYTDLLKQLEWHLSTDIWNYTPELYENEGKIWCDFENR
jgi:hypothetical protein